MITAHNSELTTWTGTRKDVHVVNLRNVICNNLFDIDLEVSILINDIDFMRINARKHLESFEYWARRLIDIELSRSYGSEYINYYEGDNYLIKKTIRESISDRYHNNKGNFTRFIDAALLDDLVSIITNPQLYKKHFQLALKHSYPCGVNHLRFVLNKLIEPRNNLSHANPISIRQAEQIICYSNDFIESLKIYYKERNEQMQFNVPQIIRVSDSIGRSVSREDLCHASNGIIWIDPDYEYNFRPKDRYRVQIEIDPSFTEDEYIINWNVNNEIMGDFNNKNFCEICLENRHVSQNLSIQCDIISKKDWHRFSYFDDSLSVMIPVFPPVE